MRAWIVIAAIGMMMAGTATSQPASAQDVAAFLAGKTKDCPGCQLAGAQRKRRNLTGANLAGANLAGASFHRAVLRGADLSGADLTDANLNKTDLLQANLSNAKLKGAMLFALWGGSVYRPTRDLDFTGYGNSDADDVVGTFKEKTESFGLSELSKESILIPITVLRYFSPVEHIDPLYIQVRRPDEVEPVTKLVREIIQRRHRPGACAQPGR